MLKKLPNAMKAAFPFTIPVMTGFLALGMAFGILMSSKGYSWYWTLLTSSVVYAGSLQFVGISMLTSVFDPLYAFLIALAVNARHIFYGISMLEQYNGTGKIKPYLIFGMTDETFSILHTTRPPPHVEKPAFMLAMTLMNHCYWVSGSVAGGLIGPLLTFNTHGIDFVMTAFFVVVFINQWRAQRNHSPALIGLGAATLCLIVFGSENFIIPAMLLIIACLTMLRPLLTKTSEGVDD